MAEEERYSGKLRSTRVRRVATVKSSSVVDAIFVQPPHNVHLDNFLVVVL